MKIYSERGDLDRLTEQTNVTFSELNRQTDQPIAHVFKKSCVHAVLFQLWEQVEGNDVKNERKF